MCSICLQTPCDSRCPNALERKPALYCERCGEPLFAGDRHYSSICESCLDELSTAEWLALIDAEMEEIGEEEVI